MAVEGNLDFELLKKFLRICEINDNVINQVVEVCKSIEDLLTNVNVWSEFVEVEEKIRIVKCANRVRYAKIEADEFCMINNIKDSCISFKNYFAYAEKYGAKVDEDIKKYKKELYKLALELYFESKKLSLAVTVPARVSVVFVDFLKDIVPKIVKIAKSNPGLMNGVVSSLDEIVAYCSEITMLSEIKGNILSGAIIFGIMTCHSIGNYVYEYYTGKISSKQCLTLIGIDVAANGASALTTTGLGVVGSIISSIFFPGVGSLIGGVIGGLIGNIIGNKYVEPLVKRLLSGEMLSNLQNIDPVCQAEMEKLYDNALKEFNVSDNTPVDLVKKLRRNYILCFHPDKQDSLNDTQTQKFIHLEACYKIIEKYRTAKGTWK